MVSLQKPYLTTEYQMGLYATSQFYPIFRDDAVGLDSMVSLSSNSSSLFWSPFSLSP